MQTALPCKIQDLTPFRRAQLEIDDSFGQKSFNAFEPNAKLSADTFVFVPPKGADVAEQ